jgi:type VI secretion system protein
VGRGNPQRLFSGDRVRFGEYEISVEIEEQTDEGEDHVDPVQRAQRVPPPDPTRADLVQPHEITAVGIEMFIDEEAEEDSIRVATKLAGDSLRLEDDPPPPKHVASVRASSPVESKQAAPTVGSGAAPAANKAGAPTPKARPRDSKAAAPVTPAPTRGAQLVAAPAAPSGSRPVSGELLDAFFRGAGVGPQSLDDKQAEQALLRLGQVMREMILGLNENLHVRVEQRHSLKIPNATKQLRDNNPLKFAAGVEEAITNLVLRPSSEYLQAVDAVREAFTEIKQHQQILLAALRVTIANYLGRLDPDELESRFSGGKRGGLIGAAHKLKYWDLYRDLYQVIAQGEPGHLPQQFLEEMARAYEAEGARGGTVPRKPQVTES